MRIIAGCADSHGRPPELPPMDGVIAWLHGGDICRGDNADDLARMTAWQRSLPVPLLAVRGNHDVGRVREWFLRCEDITGGVRRIADDLLVAGVGWAGEKHYELPAEGDLRPVCDQVRRQLLRLQTVRDRLILLTHYPPAYPGCDGHRCILDLIEQIRPIMVVTGHLHGLAGTQAQIAPSGSVIVVHHPGLHGKALRIGVRAQTR